MAALQFPCTIFTTQNWMDDYYAKDMRCGDLSESQLKANFHLLDISTRANPYTLAKITPFTQPQSMFYGARGEGEKITRQQCAALLFDEFRELSRLFSVYGPYKHLIEKMITHMQNGNGSCFSNMYLNNALKEHILNDRTRNSTLILLKNVLKNSINWKQRCIPTDKKEALRAATVQFYITKCRITLGLI